MNDDELNQARHRLRQEIKMENRKFIAQASIAIAAALGVGIAIGRFWLFHA